jgi:branched-chain amino acid transport system substrate-binding protein
MYTMARRLLYLLLAVGFAAGLPTISAAQSKDPVKVGLISSKSGVFSSFGEESLRAIQFAIDEANAEGGVDGRKVEVQIADDESTPDAGRRVAEKLARDGYNLLIGPVPSSISLAIVPNLDRWDALYVAAFGKAEQITGATCNQRSFHTLQSDPMDFAMISQWAKSFPENRFAIVAADYVWGRQSSATFEKTVESVGKKVSLALYVPLNTKDFSPYIAQLKASDAEAIWVAEVGRDAIAFVKQAQEFGLIPGKRLIGHSMMNFMVDATGDEMKGVESTTGYGPDIDTPRNRAFVAAWKAKFNRLPTDNEGYAYNGAQVLFEGIKKAHSVKPLDISAALSGAEINTIYGKVMMRAQDHQLVMPNYVARVKVADGVLRPVIEHEFDPSLTPAPSLECKM